ncbi:ChrR family anti-sigma-E factor [Marinobacterium jannaschii]|uniref:ChrR family anti-sigma-E factor n=1 Tax=Marinobacterium jannaschii TaxID=64970 RepID=UPI000484D344|nr:ChrR family anti-sigma-E factor [Marinobacterium jannaschii]
MNIHHHLDDATLLSYAAGALPQGMALLVACHLSWCPGCREKMHQAEALGGALLDTVEETAMAEDALEQMMALLDQPDSKAPVVTELKRNPAAQDSAVPGPLEHYIDQPLDRLSWKMLAPGIRHYDLGIKGEGSCRLLRIAPGTAVMPHGHKGNELTLILRGSYSDEFGRFRAGDVADLDSEVNHQPIADSGEDCICLIATDAPLHFNSIVGRLVQPLIGL